VSVEEAPLVTVESGLQLVAAIVLAGIILFELRGAAWSHSTIRPILYGVHIVPSFGRRVLRGISVAIHHGGWPCDIIVHGRLVRQQYG
jgi:hypothetical protein